MPEGDTIYRTATALRAYLLDKEVLAARARVPGPNVERVVGTTITAIEPHGKHLVVHFDNGLALHTHLRMTGSWHRYAPGERWLKPESQARLVLEVPGSVVVCFNAPVVELMDERNVERHAALRSLGPDLLADTFDAAEALARLRSSDRATLTLGEALLDQRALAGIGNVFKSEILFIERLDPWQQLRNVDNDTLRRVLATAERLLRFNAGKADAARVTTDNSPLARGSRTWVYGRAGQPCFRCRARLLSRPQGEQARRTYWCPRCQGQPDQSRTAD